ncbi:MAG: hypothetical protein MAGBODY4_00192 [Candidatus Marinimicrobia bacterium]|nr:hypothetical protein [Candidatus Neomarinimicrobiota bacterium]
MKSKINLFVFCVLTAFSAMIMAQPSSAQSGAFYGGGIGFVGSFEALSVTDWPQEIIRLSNINNANLTNETGTDIYPALMGIAGFDGNGVMAYGGQGFGQITEHIRLSGTALFGSKSISNYIEETSQTRSITIKFVKSILNTEYLWQWGRNAQFGVGAGIGIGRVSLTILQRTSDITWERIWLPFGVEGYDPSIDELGIHSTNASALFVIAQPIVSFKYQLTTWIGLRVTGGYQISRVGADAWRLNGEHAIAGAEPMSMMTPFLRGMVYFGI